MTRIAQDGRRRSERFHASGSAPDAGSPRGDFFGATMNVAARVSAQAVGGEVVPTGQAAALAAGIDGVRYEPRGRHELRHVREPRLESFTQRR